MEVMDSPSHFFSDCLAFGDADPYPDTFDRDRGTVYDQQQRSKLYDEKFFLGDSPQSRTSKAQVPRSSLWDRMDAFETGSSGEAGNQALFVDPSLYSNNNGSISGLPLPTEEQQHTSSATPESQPSMSRRASSIKSEFHGASNSGHSTDMTPPDPPSQQQQQTQQQPQKKRKPRKSKRASNTPKDEERRVKFLERNRIAASKCREKKKMFVSDLEETKINLENRHAQLQLEYNGLLGEVTVLKHRLMAHAKCGDPNIDSWLASEARRFVQTSHDPFAAAAACQFPPQPYASHTRNHSTASSHQSLGFNPIDGGAGDRRDSIAFSPGKAP